MRAIGYRKSLPIDQPEALLASQRDLRRCLTSDHLVGAAIRRAEAVGRRRRSERAGLDERRGRGVGRTADPVGHALEIAGGREPDAGGAHLAMHPKLRLVA